MKRFIKTTVTILLLITICMSMCLTAIATDSSVVYGGRETGFSFSPGSEYSPSDLFVNFKGMLPGQTYTQIINVTNNSSDSDYIKLYVKAEDIDDIENPPVDKIREDGITAVTMKEFMSHLSMTVKLGGEAGEVIFNASPDELGGFAENVYLGSFRKGEMTKLAVEISVPPELGNEYANLAGEVDWKFTAELFEDPVPSTDNSVVTVKKQWVGDDANRPESVKVNLLGDGKVLESVTLDDANQWTYTWTELSDFKKWTVEEADVPEGYTVSYKSDGNVTTIINTKVVPDTPVIHDPIDLTAVKKWSGDENDIKKRPDSAKITLYNGTKAVETVILNDENDWTFTWKNLNPEGDWKILETDIPKGYTPVYSSKDGVVTVTNTATLVQTGQLKWPVAVLTAVGAVMILYGGAIIVLKRRDERA